MVLAVGTLEFCEDLALVLGNLAKAMQTGGRLFMSVVERRPNVRMQDRAKRPLSEVDLVRVSMFLYSFGAQTAAIEQAGLVPWSYRLHPGWRHAEYDVDVLYALWDLERGRAGAKR